jgi:hypothetical protein
MLGRGEVRAPFGGKCDELAAEDDEALVDRQEVCRELLE